MPKKHGKQPKGRTESKKAVSSNSTHELAVAIDQVTLNDNYMTSEDREKANKLFENSHKVLESLDNLLVAINSEHCKIKSEYEYLVWSLKQQHSSFQTRVRLWIIHNPVVQQPQQSENMPRLKRFRRYEAQLLGYQVEKSIVALGRTVCWVESVVEGVPPDYFEQCHNAFESILNYRSRGSKLKLGFEHLAQLGLLGEAPSSFKELPKNKFRQIMHMCSFILNCGQHFSLDLKVDENRRCSCESPHTDHAPRFIALYMLWHKAVKLYHASQEECVGRLEPIIAQLELQTSTITEILEDEYTLTLGKERIANINLVCVQLGLIYVSFVLDLNFRYGVDLSGADRFNYFDALWSSSFESIEALSFKSKTLEKYKCDFLENTGEAQINFDSVSQKADKVVIDILQLSKTSKEATLFKSKLEASFLMNDFYYMALEEAFESDMETARQTLNEESSSCSCCGRHLQSQFHRLNCLSQPGRLGRRAAVIYGRF